MAKQKISNIAKELNVGLPNIFEFLRKHNIEIVESPNSRVEDSVVAMLTHHFQPDRELKTRSDQQTSDRRQLRADARAQAPARSAEPDLAHTPSDLAQKPRILGKIELDSKGNPVKPEPKPQPKPAPKQEPKQEPKPAPAPAPEIEKKPEPAPVETQKAEPTPAAKPKAETPAKAAAPAPVKKEESPQPKPQTLATNQPSPEAAATASPAPAAEQSSAAPSEPEVFTTGSTPRVQGPVILGKIDLSAINSNTRPKKKTKEERRNERKAQQGTGAQGTGAGGDSRRKRNRIGGSQKVDIEKAGRQAANEPRPQRERGGAGSGRPKTREARTAVRHPHRLPKSKTKMFRSR